MAKVATKSVKGTKATTKSVAVKAAETTNAYREGSSYWSIIETLRKLGAGKFHPASALIKAYPAVVGAEAWKAFKAKGKRNDETGKDAEGRIIQNAVVLNRPDYGKSQREQTGTEVRKGRDATGYVFGLFKLTDKTPAPVRPTKAATKAAGTTAAKGKAKAAAKSAKAPAAKAKAPKAKAAKGSKKTARQVLALS
jgi:hypothetical protein